MLLNFCLLVFKTVNKFVIQKVEHKVIRRRYLKTIKKMQITALLLYNVEVL